MNAVYFAIGCILVIAVIFWGSAETEPLRLSVFFGQRRQEKPGAKIAEASKDKRG